MSALPYHKRYHGDALTGFMALTLEERGAYQTILDMIYDHGGPIMDNERLLAGYMNCSLRKWRLLRDELIAKHKIKITRDGLITNERAEKEIENTTKTSRKLIEAGSKGGRARAENEKKNNENNESELASLEAGLSEAQAISEARSQKKKPIVKKETALPDGWTPESFGDGKCKAIVDSWTPDQLATQIEKFTAHHRTRGNRWADWQSAWQTWVLNSVQFAQPRHSPAEPKTLHAIINERMALDRLGATA